MITRLYPNAQQRAALDSLLDQSLRGWNRMLAKNIRGTRPALIGAFQELCADLPEYRNTNRISNLMTVYADRIARGDAQVDDPRAARVYFWSKSIRLERRHVHLPGIGTVLHSGALDTGRGLIVSRTPEGYFMEPTRSHSETMREVHKRRPKPTREPKPPKSPKIKPPPKPKPRKEEVIDSPYFTVRQMVNYLIAQTRARATQP